MGSRIARSTVGIALMLGLGGQGCIHVHTDPEGHVQAVEMKLTDTLSAKKSATDDVKQVAGSTATAAVLPVAPTSPTVSPPPPAAATSIGARFAAMRASLPKFTSLVKPAAIPVAEVTALWQNRIAHLPDPTKSGSPGAGLVGELFLIGAGPKMPFAEAEGKVTFTIYDESNGVASSHPLGSWTYDKETLQRLVSVDERLGKCYAIFLPWPEYTSAITRVRLTTRYQPESGHALFATTWVTFDNRTSPGEQAWNVLPDPTPAIIPPAAESKPKPSGMATGAMTLPPPTPLPAEAAPTYQPAIPLNGSAPTSVTAPALPALPPTAPTELPPLSITLPNRP